MTKGMYMAMSTMITAGSVKSSVSFNALRFIGLMDFLSTPLPSFRWK